MNALLANIHTHHVMWALIAYYVGSSAVSALPAPVAGSNGFYRWFFDFSHAAAGNIMRVVATHYPQLNGTNGNTANQPPKAGGQ